MRRKREMEKLGNGMCLERNFLPSNQLKPSERGRKIEKRKEKRNEKGREKKKKKRRKWIQCFLPS